MNSKKLLVLSDTHGDITSLKIVLNWAKERIPPKDSICAAVFLGDGITDLKPAAEATGFYSDWKLVRGNNDYGVQVPEAAVFDFAGNKFFICHGHRYNIYGGYHTLIAAANNMDANVALFGHTHVPYNKMVNGIHLVNPGSIGLPRSRIGETFAVIECTQGKALNIEFWGINGNRKIVRQDVK
ncbi:MAG: metallophosphoesterase [Treponema sp.]|nr:metallophosphoesterase [Treponema sp.]